MIQHSVIARSRSQSKAAMIAMPKHYMCSFCSNIATLMVAYVKSPVLLVMNGKKGRIREAYVKSPVLLVMNDTCVGMSSFSARADPAHVSVRHKTYAYAPLRIHSLSTSSIWGRSHAPQFQFGSGRPHVSTPRACALVGLAETYIGLPDWPPKESQL